MLSQCPVPAITKKVISCWFWDNSSVFWSSLGQFFQSQAKKTLSFPVYQFFNRKRDHRNKLFRHHAWVFYTILFNHKRHHRKKLFRHRAQLFIQYSLIIKNTTGINYLKIIQTQYINTQIVYLFLTIFNYKKAP